ncbi:DUF1565 domain-containing protein [Paenibacillus ginsengihumi]|uniref:DUF1565 domain-containing protein n=1 Tax=Paenibacillus ginsengihumi TaxID=431596 RepID=UPI00036DD23A|nr:DUF1565 domain-containing protein [Paenibacillus ginsengihumi]
MAKTDWTMNDTVMPEDMNELGAEVNAKVNHSLADATYYVNASTGSDTNDGLSAEKALKTIGAAIAKVPQVINHIVNIIVADGLYDEDIFIDGYVGRGHLYLRGDITTPDNVSIRSLSVHQCTGYVDVAGFTITGLNVNNKHVIVDRCKSVDLHNLKTTVALFQNYAVELLWSTVAISASEISNKLEAIRARQGAVVYVYDCVGTGNDFAYVASGGARISPVGTRIGAKTMYNVDFGGVVAEAIPGATTGVMNLYVSPNGNDVNNGTSGAPLKTIQAAINRIPPIVNHTVIINVAPGTYNEIVKVAGFQGQGIIHLYAGNAISMNYSVSAVAVDFCSCQVVVRGFNGTATDRAPFSANNSFDTKFEKCSVTAASTYHSGYHVINNGMVTIINCKVTNRVYGAFLNGAAQIMSIEWDDNSTGNTIGLVAQYGVITKQGVQPRGTTSETTGFGGMIR